MSFMIKCNTFKTSPLHPVENKQYTFSVTDVKEQIPNIRQKLTLLRKRLKTQESKTSGKSKQLANRIQQLILKRNCIMNNLPHDLIWLHQLHYEDIIGFEESLFKHGTIFLQKSNLNILHRKCKCKAMTLKGTPCTRYATSPTDKYCKIHS